MEKIEYIESIENSTIKKIKKLKSKKYRELEKAFLAEGYKFLDFDYEPKIILIREDIENDSKIIKKLNKFSCRKIKVAEKVFEKISSQENSQGVIIVYPQIESNIENIKNDIIILDKVQDPGNIGTIIRVAASAGFKDIILSKGSCDIYNEKAVRSTMGSLFSMNIIYMEANEIIDYLKKKEYKFLVTALEDKSIPYTDMKLNEKNALIFGSEGNGVSENFLKNADDVVLIPIYGMAESLNVAIASGIMMYKLREIRNREGA